MRPLSFIGKDARVLKGLERVRRCAAQHHRLRRANLAVHRAMSGSIYRQTAGKETLRLPSGVDLDLRPDPVSASGMRYVTTLA